MEFVITLLFVLFGLLVGSFLNVVIDRLPAGQSLAFPPSHCSSCKIRLAVKDLIPIFSYTLLKGRCRYCGERITMRIPLVEAATAVAFGLIFWFGSTHWFLASYTSYRTPDYTMIILAIIYFCLLLVIAVIDLEHGLILDKLTYTTMILALVISLSRSLLDFATNASSFVPDITHAAIGCGIGLVLFLLIVLLSRGGMGLGDVKMAALMGIMLGYPSVLIGIFLAIMAGGITAIVLLVTRKKGRKQTIPFGPFLALGAMLALLWGNSIWGWYTRGFS